MHVHYLMKLCIHGKSIFVAYDIIHHYRLVSNLWFTATMLCEILDNWHKELSWVYLKQDTIYSLNIF